MQRSSLSLEEAIFLVEKKLRSSVYGYDIFGLERKTLDVEIKNQKLERSSKGEEAGFGLRLYHRQRQGFACSFGLHPRQVPWTINQAMQSLKACHPHPAHAPFSAPATFPHRDLDLFDPSVSALEIESKVKFLKNFESDIIHAEKSVARTDGVLWSENEERQMLLNRQGLCLTQRETAIIVSGEAIAEHSKNQESFSDAQCLRHLADLNPRSLALKMATEAAAGLDAQEPPTGHWSVLFCPEVASEWMEILAQSFYGDEVFFKRSFLTTNKFKKPIFSSLVSIIDDGRLPRGFGSTHFDGDGVSSQRTHLVDRGQLTGFLLDQASAHRMGLASTGNCRRESLKTLPCVGHSNFFIDNGTTPFNDLVADLGTGIVLKKVMGLHLADLVTGDFSVGGSGLWVENGKISHAVRNFTVSGNFFTALKHLKGLGNDLKFHGPFGSPSLLFSPLAISGA